MAKEKKKTGPEQPSPERLAMSEAWSAMDSLLGGTASMRAAANERMPMHPGEDAQRYKERLASAVLWNQTELTLCGWVGRPFRNPLKLKDDVPDKITDLRQDIDMQGNNIDVFCRKWFRTGVAKAFCHVLVEQPFVPVREDGSKPSKADTDKQGVRPYWVLIQPEDIISARSEVINGKEVWTTVRMYESVLIQDPEDEFSEVIENRIKVYDRIDGEEGVTIRLRIFVEKRENKKDKKTKWVLEEVRGLDFDEIPLITFYADKLGFLLGKSPLQDLADLNIKHWQDQSDQDTILRIARFPILAGSGVDSLDGGDTLNADPQSSQTHRKAKSGHVMGPHTVLLAEDPKAKFYYVEHTGAAIGTGQEALDKLEEKMSAYGSEFLKKSPDRQTATAKTLDSAESVSPLVAVTLLFVDAVEQALAMTAKWLSIEKSESVEKPGGSVELVTDFGPEEASAIDLSTLTAAWAGGSISSRQYRRELKRRGVLADDFSEEDNEKELQDQALDLSATSLPASKIDLDEPANDKKEKDDETENTK